MKLLAISILLLISSNGEVSELADKTGCENGLFSTDFSDVEDNELADDTGDDNGLFSIHPKSTRNAIEIVKMDGYEPEEHWVTTTDGYILYLLRIKSKKGKMGSRVAFFMSGIGFDCTYWILNDADKNLPYILADQGVDVWLGNNRGTKYSTNHTTLNTDNVEFWKFGWSEMATYDLPAFVDFVTSITGASKISYIGHSQGTALAFAAFSENSISADKFKHFFALAPVARVDHTTSILKFLVPFRKRLEEAVTHLEHGAVTQVSYGVKMFLYMATGEACFLTSAVHACKRYYFAVFGKSEVLDTNQWRLYIALGSSVSIRTLVQWMQCVASGKFQHYDNGTAAPAEYDLSKVTVPVIAFSAANDALSVPKDVDWLLTQLKNVMHHRLEGFSHNDLVIANAAVKKVFTKISETIMNR